MYQQYFIRTVTCLIEHWTGCRQAETVPVSWINYSLLIWDFLIGCSHSRCGSWGPAVESLRGLRAGVRAQRAHKSGQRSSICADQATTAQLLQRQGRTLMQRGCRCLCCLSSPCCSAVRVCLPFGFSEENEYFRSDLYSICLLLKHHLLLQNLWKPYLSFLWKGS